MSTDHAPGGERRIPADFPYRSELLANLSALILLWDSPAVQGQILAKTGEEIDQEGLGGVDAHGKKSGVVHVVARDEADAYARARSITTLFARPGRFDLGAVRADTDLPALPADSRQRLIGDATNLRSAV